MIVVIAKPNVYSEFGILMPVGSTQTVSDSYGAALVSQLLATVSSSSPVVTPNRPFDQIPGSSPYVPSGGQSATPVILLPSGIVATNGQITLGTALPTIYANAWGFLPAGAVAGDATGGLYFIQFSSTTVGTVYAGKVGGATGVTSAWAPSIPASLVAAVGSNSGYTQTTGAEIALVNVTIPGGSMGPNGMLWSAPGLVYNNSATSKLMRTLAGGQVVISKTRTTSTLDTYLTDWRNRGVATSQVSVEGNIASFGSGQTAPPTYASVNTTLDQPFVYTAQLVTTATDFIILEGFSVQIIPGV